MNKFGSYLVEEIKVVDQERVDGLIEMCKFLATQGEVERAALMFMEIDPLVVLEAKKKLGF